MIDIFPQKLTALDSEEERSRYKIVPLDTFVAVIDLILTAYAETGICIFRGKNGARYERKFEAGIRIMRR